eukprot:7978322-Heterocapsa_arctica.AAC.1
MKAKRMKVMCAGLPQRAKTISHMVCAVRALRFTSIARMPKSRTWIVSFIVMLVSESLIVIV